SAGTLGSAVGSGHVDGEVGVDHRYACVADAVSDLDALTARHQHAEVRIRLESRARAADLDAISLAVRVATGLLVTPRSIVADIDGRMVRTATTWVDNTLGGIDHA